ncbi:MAG TPA: glycosyltransferase family 39 protein [Gemmatimonadales bacterium]
MTPTRLTALAAGAVLLGAALVFGIGRYPLLEPDEGRNAEVAREMAASGDFVVPHLDGLPYPDKPVLYFAAAALSIRAFGATALAARLPALVATLLTLVLIAVFARRRYGDRGGWIAVIVAGTAPLTIAFAHTVIFDSMLALFVTAAVLGFALSAEASERSGPNAWLWSTGAWGAIGLGILTKGPIAIALPLLVVLPWAVWRKRVRAVLDPVGILLATAIVAPWVLAMSRRVPGFIHYALATETLERLTTPALARTGPIWYFLPIILAGALPWSLVLLAGSRKTWATLKARDTDAALLVAWVLIPLVFFSLSQSKRPQYLVPLMPAVGLLVAHLWSSGGRLSGVRTAAWGMAALGVTLGLGATSLARAFGAGPAVLAAAPGAGWALAACCVIGAALALSAPTHPVVAVLGLAFPVATLPVSGGGLLGEVARERSSQEIAQAIRPLLGDATRVVAAGAFPLSLPYYLGRTVLLASPDAGELTSNYLVRSPASRYVEGTPLRPADWWRDAMISCDRPVIVVVRQNDRARRAVLDVRVPLLIETPRYAVYGPCGKSNRALTPHPNAQGAP